MAQQQYPELDKYHFDLPTDYNFRAWSEHSMPTEMFNLFQELLTK
jgi:hypothetical protein